MKDNLFDTKFTFLDAVKILLLIVTAFSTWNVIDIMTPDGSLSFIREFAAVGVVEGAFLGFEFATAKAKNKRQVQLATLGFFCSLAVIGMFAAASGLLEFGGPTLLAQSVGTWLSIAWTAADVVKVAALTVLVSWFVVLAAIYRVYSIYDPDKTAELTELEINGEVKDEANNALKMALNKAKSVIASTRAEATVQKTYGRELTAEQMGNLIREISAELRTHYGATPQAEPIPAQELATPFYRNEAEAPAPGTSFRGDNAEPKYHPGYTGEGSGEIQP